MTTTEDIAQRIKTIMGAARPSPIIEVDSPGIASKAIDKVLSEEHLEKFASMIDTGQSAMVTDDISVRVQEAVTSQMNEIINKLDV